jgi:hypothetical protein
MPKTWVIIALMRLDFLSADLNFGSSSITRHVYGPGTPEYLGGVAETGFTDDGYSFTRYTDGGIEVRDADGTVHTYNPEAGNP